MPTTYPSPFARNPNWRAKFGVTVLNDGGGFNGARLLTNGITSIGAIVGLVSDQLGTVDVTLAITTATCSRAIGPLVGYPSESKFVILLFTLGDKDPYYYISIYNCYMPESKQKTFPRVTYHIFKIFTDFKPHW